jgi:vitamin-K-epoxide reductase (warfarin-sensitive)
MSGARRLEAALAVLAFLIAGYLTYERHEGQNALCPVGGGGCETVAHSSYSKFAGVPVSYFGMLGAIALFVLCFRSELLFASLRFVVSGVGAAFSLYLTSLEATKINAYCVWCLGSATVWCLLVIIAGVDVWRLAGSSEAAEAT